MKKSKKKYKKRNKQQIALISGGLNLIYIKTNWTEYLCKCIQWYLAAFVIFRSIRCIMWWDLFSILLIWTIDTGHQVLFHKEMNFYFWWILTLCREKSSFLLVDVLKNLSCLMLCCINIETTYQAIISYRHAPMNA